jgi:hypothetical protein
VPPPALRAVRLQSDGCPPRSRKQNQPERPSTKILAPFTFSSALSALLTRRRRVKKAAVAGAGTRRRHHGLSLSFFLLSPPRQEASVPPPPRVFLSRPHGGGRELWPEACQRWRSTPHLPSLSFLLLAPRRSEKSGPEPVWPPCRRVRTPVGARTTVKRLSGGALCQPSCLRNRYELGLGFYKTFTIYPRRSTTKLALIPLLVC